MKKLFKASAISGAEFIGSLSVLISVIIRFVQDLRERSSLISFQVSEEFFLLYGYKSTRALIGCRAGIIFFIWVAPRAGKMNEIARCDWLPACPLGTTRCIPQAKFPQKPYNKSFIDQVCSVKMAGYWPRSFFCEFMDLDFVLVHEHAKKELGQYPAILTSHFVNNPYVMTGHYDFFFSARRLF